MPVDTQAAIELLKELRTLTADENGAQRLAWTPMWIKARDWFQSKLRELPVEHHYDAAGNSWTTLSGTSNVTSIPCPMEAGSTAAWA
jgi:N-carbamoyl-L-amino-acid hydrolase